MKIHFSIDDVIGCFLWLSKNNAVSIFESRIFAFVKQLYDKFGIMTTCNCMFSDGASTLKGVPDKWKEQFQDNADWLKFSFHCYDYESNYKLADKETIRNDYNVVMSELIRITGGGSAISDEARLHFFAGSTEAMKALGEMGVHIVFAADDERGSYDLKKDEEEQARHEGFKSLANNLLYEATDIRLENVTDVQDALNRVHPDKKRLVVFTHEKYIGMPEIQERLFEICEVMKEL